MAKKKMCHNWMIPDNPEHKKNLVKWNKCECDFMDITCPKDTNARCEIITPKPKDKVVKAWVTIIGEQYPMIYAVNLYKPYSVPCEIRVKAADWAKLKGEK